MRDLIRRFNNFMCFTFHNAWVDDDARARRGKKRYYCLQCNRTFRYRE